MFPNALVIPTAFLLLAGCGRTQPSAADPDVARGALQTALNAWKQGGDFEELRGQSPAIYVADEDWHRSWKLVNFKMEDEGNMQGLSLACAVRLNMTDPKGDAAEKRVVYRIATQPNISIVRDDRHAERDRAGNKSTKDD